MGVKIDSRKVRAGEKWIFRKTTNMTAGARPLRWVGSYTPPPPYFYLRTDQQIRCLHWTAILVLKVACELQFSAFRR